MKKKALLMLLFITVLYSLSTNALDEVIIRDELLETNTFRENIMIKLENHDSNGTFKFSLPQGAYEAMINNESVEGDIISVPLNCTNCILDISYNLDDIIIKKGNLYSFSRTLNLPKNPKVFSYSIEIPPGYIVDLGKDDPAIVPFGELKTDGKNIIVAWEETNPQLPKIYFVRYKKIKSSNGFLFLIFGLFIGVGGTYLFFKYYKKMKPSKNVESIPSSLLSPDEIKIINLLENNKKVMNQREMVKVTDWSKSKVSAILSNLDYKKIIDREKQGRNYKVKLIKTIQ